MRKNTFDWFRLDNAAKIFPGQNARAWSNVFRLGAELKSEVDPEILRVALNNTLKRIPTFNVRIRNGAFWHYFEKNPGEAPIKPDVKNICYRINFKENIQFPITFYGFSIGKRSWFCCSSRKICSIGCSSWCWGN